MLVHVIRTTQKDTSAGENNLESDTPKIKLREELHKSAQIEKNKYAVYLLPTMEYSMEYPVTPTSNIALNNGAPEPAWTSLRNLWMKEAYS